MGFSCVVLAGGDSKRLGTDKALVEVGGKPLILRVCESVEPIVDEIIVVVGSREKAEEYSSVLDGLSCRYAIDRFEHRSPLVGAVSGFREARHEHAVLLPCDAPFVSLDAVSLLMEIAPSFTAVIPRWPNGYIEPLHAVYKTKAAAKAGAEALSKGKLDMKSMINKLRNVLYVSTMVLAELDSQHLTLFNVNTIADLRRAQVIAKKLRRREAGEGRKC